MYKTTSKSWLLPKTFADGEPRVGSLVTMGSCGIHLRAISTVKNICLCVFYEMLSAFVW